MINLRSNFLRIIRFCSKILSEEHFIRRISVCHCSQFVCHCISGYHSSCYFSYSFQVIACSGRHIFQNKFFRNTTSKQLYHFFFQLLFRSIIPIFLRSAHSESARHSSWNNSNLMNRIAEFLNCC